jgi:hypothetical protein
MKSLLGKLGVILIGLTLLIYAEVCRAECAWVLWLKFENISFVKDKPPIITENWELIAAVPKYEQCLIMQKEIFEKQIKGWEKVEGAKIDSVPFALITVQHPKGGSQFIKLNCFPDTIDPRK